MKIKTKIKININKIFTVLTVLCVIFSFAAVIANAAPPIKADYVIDSGNTLVFGAGDLFKNLAPLDTGKTPVIYPGESSMFTIQVNKPADARATVTMEIEKIDSANPKNLATGHELADYIRLTILDEAGVKIYDGMLSELPIHTRRIIFVANAHVYTFKAEFIGLSRNATTEIVNETGAANASNQYGTTQRASENLDTGADGWQNELMSLTAAFRVRFIVETPEIITETTATTGTTGTTETTNTTAPTQGTTATTEVIIPDTTPPLADFTTAPATTEAPVETEPATTTETPVEPTATTAATTETTIETTTASTTEATAEITTTTEEEVFIPDTTPPLPAFTTEPFSEMTSEGVTVVDEYFTDATLPLPGFTSNVDDLSKTGEHTNPMLNIIIGLALALIGFIVILGVAKKKKDDEEDENPENGNKG